MFGIDQISWKDFTCAVVVVLSVWYLSLAGWYYLNRLRKKKKPLFENDLSGAIQPEELQPIMVSSDDFPSQMIRIPPLKDVPLPASFYEAMGVDDGYSLDRLQDSGDPLPPSVMQQIQYQ